MVPPLNKVGDYSEKDYCSGFSIDGFVWFRNVEYLQCSGADSLSVHCRHAQGHEGSLRRIGGRV